MHHEKQFLPSWLSWSIQWWTRDGSFTLISKHKIKATKIPRGYHSIKQCNFIILPIKWHTIEKVEKRERKKERKKKWWGGEEDYSYHHRSKKHPYGSRSWTVSYWSSAMIHDPLVGRHLWCSVSSHLLCWATALYSSSLPWIKANIHLHFAIQT